MADNVIEYILRMKNEASPALARVASDSKEAAAEVGRFGDRAGAVGQSAQKLAGALSLISPEAGAAAQTLADFADVGEVASSVAGSLGVSVGSVLSVLGPVAVAAGAASLAFVAISGDIERAAAEAAALHEINLSLVDSTRSLRDAELLRAVALGQLTEAQAAQQAVQNAARDAVVDFGEAQAAQRAQLRQSIADAEKWIDVTSMIPNLGAPIADAIFGWSDSIESANRQLGALDDALVKEAANQKEIRKATVETMAAQEQQTAATNRKTVATKASTDATRAAAEAERLWAAAQAEARAATQAREAAEASLQGIIASVYTAEERARAAYAERSRVIQDAIDKGAKEADVLAAMAANTRKLAEDLKAATAEQEKFNTATGGAPAGPTVGDTLGTVGSAIANPLSAAAAADPTGITGGVIAIATAVSYLGDTFTNLRDLLGGVADGLATGGRDAAKFIGDVVGDLVPAILQAVPEFILGFVDGIPQMIERIAEGLPQLAVSFLELFTPLAAVLAVEVAVALVSVLADPNTWIEAGTAFADGLMNALTKFLDRVVDSIETVTGVGSVDRAVTDVGGFFDNLFSGSFDTGTDYVHRTGLAMVHQGERIVNNAGTSSGRTAALLGGGGGGDVHLHLSGFAIGTVEQLVREMNRVLGTNGRRVAWATGA